MEKYELFSERDTLEEAVRYATELIMTKLDQSDHMTAFTVLWVTVNTAIKLLEKKEAARKVKISFQIQSMEEPLPPGTYHVKIVEGTEPLPDTSYAPASNSPESRAILTRKKIDAFTRLVSNQSDLNFILSILEHTVAQEKMRKEQPL